MSNNLIVYSLVGCPYSIKTEKTIKALNIDANIIKVEYSNKNYIKSIHNFESFPQVCLGDTNTIIGGSDDFHTSINKLKSILYGNESTDNKINQIKNISFKKYSNIESKLAYAYTILKKLYMN